MSTSSSYVETWVKYHSFPFKVLDICYFITLVPYDYDTLEYAKILKEL